VTAATTPTRVRGHGWLEWATVGEVLAGATCAWADLDGFHIDPCPAQPPHTSHLWAWHGRDMWRARIDAGRTLLTQLTTLDTGGPDTITTTCYPGMPWPQDYGAIGEQPPGVLDQAYELFEVPGDPAAGSAAVLFVRRAAPAGGDRGA
jgi:hypothetical protein